MNSHQNAQNVCITMHSEKEIVLMRVENGWLIRSVYSMAHDAVRPMRVAESLGQLVEEVRQWGAQQEQAGPQGDAR